MKWYMAFHKKRTWLLLFIPISLLTLWIARSNVKIAEYVFAEGLYRWISQGLSLITGLVPFSVMELEIISLPVITLIIVMRFVRKLIRTARKKQGGTAYLFAEGILNTACVLGLILFLYVNLAGVNYYRYPFSVFGDLEIKEASVDELYGLCSELAVNAANIRTQLTEQNAEDSNGVLKVDRDGWKEVSKIAGESYEKAAKEYPILGGNYASPKTVFFSEFMSRMEITGIFWPFTMEANVNIDAGEYAVPAAMCHELAHLRGFMREDEANFIAYLVSRQSDNLEFQYSGTMLALAYAGEQLYIQDEDLYRQVQDVYTEGMRADIREDYYYWKQFEDTVISTVSNTMNDTYLKVNSQNDGVKSYGRMVDLLLADYRKNHPAQFLKD